MTTENSTRNFVIAAKAHDLSGQLATLRQITTAPATTARVRIGAITLKKHVAIDLMAQEIIHSAENGCVREADFLRLGFSTEQIALWSGEAYRRAIAKHPKLAAMLEWA